MRALEEGLDEVADNCARFRVLLWGFPLVRESLGEKNRGVVGGDLLVKGFIIFV